MAYSLNCFRMQTFPVALTPSAFSSVLYLSHQKWNPVFILFHSNFVSRVFICLTTESFIIFPLMSSSRYGLEENGRKGSRNHKSIWNLFLYLTFVVQEREFMWNIYKTLHFSFIFREFSFIFMYQGICLSLFSPVVTFQWEFCLIVTIRLSFLFLLCENPLKM